MIVVVDLDGTLCNSAHREHLARAKQWDEFHRALREDEPNQDVLQVLGTISWRFTIVGLTGRNEVYRPATLKWLKRHEVVLDDLLMRPDGDWRQDHVLKPELLDVWLEANGHQHSDVLLILEDREKVVEAWRDLGHNCWQVRASGH